jgi:hypothetical protein
MSVVILLINVKAIQLQMTLKQSQNYFTTGGLLQISRLGDKTLENHDTVNLFSNCILAVIVLM